MRAAPPAGEAAAPAPMNRPGRPAALARLGELYDDLDREIAALAPKCELSGRCCDFPTSGLTLFATDLELEWLRERTPAGRNDDPALCPHWRGGRCEARDGRPLGCRLYFCDATRAAALDDLSMRYHARLKRIHDETGHPYRYGPFLPRVRAASR
jgi:Fe-S-cluster containining protein